MKKWICLIAACWLVALFASRDDVPYVITPHRPGGVLTAKNVEVSSNTSVTMPGAAQSLKWDRSGLNLTIEVPGVSVDEVPCKYAYVFKITHVR